jgi:hypothetical protein
MSNDGSGDDDDDDDDDEGRKYFLSRPFSITSLLQITFGNNL